MRPEAKCARRITVAFALLMLRLAATAGAAEVAEALRAAGAAQAKVSVLRARFEQEKHVEIVEGVLRSEGRLLVSREHGVVWEIEKPDRQRIVVAAAGIFVDGRRIDAAPGAGDAIPIGRLSALFTGVSETLLEDFEVALLDADRLRLTPRHEGLGRLVREITLTLDPERRLPVRVTLAESDGTRSEVRLHDLELDPALPGGAFAP